MKGKTSLGYISISCQITKRYLQISKISHNATGSELIAIRLNQGLCSSHKEEPCSLFVKKDDLYEALENVQILE